MKIIIDILKIRCARTTIELGKDEIYAAVFLTALKKEGNTFTSALKPSKPLWGVVTDIERLVVKNKIWKPTQNHFEISIDNDTEAIGFSFALYEKDNGKIFEKMKQEMTGPIEPEGFVFSSIELPEDITDPNKVAKFLFDLLKKAIIHFRQDDMLDVKEFVESLEKLNGDEFPREFRFERKRGIYDMSILIKTEL